MRLLFKKKNGEIKLTTFEKMLYVHIADRLFKYYDSLVLPNITNEKSI